METVRTDERRGREGSTAKKLVQAAAFAAMLVPLASVAAHGSTISCGFGSGTSGPCQSVGSGGNDRIFDFGGQYSVELDFFDLTRSFTISMTDVPANQDDFTPIEGTNRFGNFPGARCVDLVDPVQQPTDPCREFDVDTDAATAAGNGYSAYSIVIRWAYDSNALFPDDNGRIRLVHDSSQDTSDLFFDITTPGSYEAEPAIGGLDNNFQAFTVLQTSAVPEPATLLLVGAGIGAAYRRRRKG